MSAPEWLNDLQEANRLFEEKKYDETEAVVRRIIERDPKAAVPHQLLGLVHVDRFEIPEALERLQHALSLRPDLPVAHNSLGHCQVLLGNDEAALDHFNTALYLEPQHVLAHYNRSVVWLKRGQFREGWVEHEWRFAAGVAKRQEVPRPLWDGSSLEGRSILIYTEQGLGDVLMFARFLPILRRKAARLVIACHHPLRPFFESLDCIDDWFPIDQPHDINFDVYAAMMSVAPLLQMNHELRFPHSVPYLFAEPARIEAWRRPVRDLPGFKVGLVWQGNPLFRVDRYRSVPLHHFAPLATVPGVTFVSLQHGHGTEQIEPNRDKIPLTLLPELDRDGVFLDRAAVMQHLDLIITTDTSAAHLAGGLGRPVWVILAANCDWRWMHDRSDSPWYPTMRLFRQRKLGEWGPVLEEVAEALRKFVPPHTPEPVEIIIPMSPGELLDRIVVEQRRAATAETAAESAQELTRLQQVRNERIPDISELEPLVAELERLHDERTSVEEQLRQPGKKGRGKGKVVEKVARIGHFEVEREDLIRRINAVVEEAHTGSAR